MLIVPNNWSDLQHYKDRSPPWIKLHKKLLDNYEYQCLPVASKALAPMLWLLASEHENGVIDADPKRLGFRLRMTEVEVEEALQPLITAGFFSERKQPASKRIAKQEASARLETEEEAEEEAEEEESAASQRPSRQVTLKTYLQSCREQGIKPVPDTHPVRAYCRDAGIADEMLQVAWCVFREDYTTGTNKDKRYKDWPGHFANAVRGCWAKLWFTDSGEVKWSSRGLQEKAVLETRMKAKEESHAA